MLKAFDNECNSCKKVFEDFLENDEVAVCPGCSSKDTRRIMPRSFNKPFEVIRCTSLTSGAYKAGTVHKFKRPATKIQVSVL